MNFSKKKIIIGTIIAFFVMINIYNIPLKGTTDEIKKEDPLSIIKENIINTSKLEKAINLSSEKTYSIKDYKSVLLTFWATWCPSCKYENEILNEFVKKHKDFLVLGISMDKDKSALNSYLQKIPLNFDAFYVTKEISVFFDDINVVPTHYLVDVESGLVMKQLGLITEEEIINLANIKNKDK